MVSWPEFQVKKKNLSSTLCDLFLNIFFRPVHPPMDLLETFARGPFQDIPLPSEVAARLVKILLNHMVLQKFFFVRFLR